MPVDQKLVLTDKLSDMEFEIIDPEMTEFSVANRIEYQIVQTNQRLTELNIKNYKSQYLPTLNANFNYGWTSGTNSFSDLTEFNDETWFNFSSIGVTMSIPIFDGLRKSYINQQNRLSLKQLDKGLKQTKNNIKREIESSVISYNNSIRNMRTQKENMELAEDVFEVTRIKYKEGVGSNLEVVEAESDLKEAQTNYYSALYDAFVAKIDLLKAQGRLHK